MIVCQDVGDPLNIGAIFRLSDAMGVQHIHLCGMSPKPPHRKISKTARSTEQMVPFTYHHSVLDALVELKKAQYQLIGLEITDQSQTIESTDFTQGGPIALVLGAESGGIFPTTLALLDHTVHIPMYGNNTSMNVVQSCAIAMYEITKQLGASAS